ncbi:hypothetical protein PSHT_09337 [Puccinia striiformis]|uniref:Uncharacterized protein n=1 Tax=Puccinia striiformis TaxID=27350 RepID=A0A2S4VHC2_9BASI|nr:hypothetical protein Pst134EB_014195 [Puccinia striiformis f. sp. tritici]POW08944.1 hypothetical protein PSHT_09337 [Puccinia striiformis]
MQSRHPLHLSLWSLTAFSAATNLSDLEFTQLDQGPFAATSRPPLWALFTDRAERLAPDGSTSKIHSLPTPSLPEQDVLERSAVSSTAHVPSTIHFEPLVDAQASASRKMRYDQGKTLPLPTTPIYYEFMPGSSHLPGTGTPVWNQPSLSRPIANMVHNPSPVQAPIPLDNLGLPMLNTHSQVNQGSGQPSHFNEGRPLKRKFSGSVEVNRTPVKKSSGSPPRSPRSGAVQISVPIIYRYYRALEQKLHSNDFKVWGVPWQNIHRTLPIGYMMRPNKPGARIMRIIDKSRMKTQPWRVIKPLYKGLIYRIYDTHLERSNNPTEHLMHVRNIFNRINNEIFSPENGVPLLGFSYPTAKGWKADFYETKLGYMQEKISTYLSGETKDQLFSLASELIQTYYRDLERNTPALKSYLEKPIEIDAPDEVPMEPHFRARFEFIFDLAGGHGHFQEFLNRGGDSWVPNHPRYTLSIESFTNFGREFRMSQQKTHRTNPRTDHASLSIALLLHKKVETTGSMRVLDTTKNRPYGIGPFIAVMNHLIKSVEFFHVAILNQLQITRKESSQRELDLLSWIGKEITQPKDSYPVFGTIQEDMESTNLEARMLGGDKLFGPVQLKLIKYFNTSQLAKSLFPETRHTASFLIATWYQIYHTREFNNFFFTHFLCENLEEAEARKSHLLRPFHHQGN